MKTMELSRDYSQQILNTSSINIFYSIFPEHREILMKNQMKNKKIELSTLKELALNNQFPNKAHQVLLGSLLGDMHCRKEHLNSDIQESHSLYQKYYLMWKYSVLKDHLRLKLTMFHNPVCKANGKMYNRKPEIRLRSLVSEKLNYYHDLFYKNNKKEINQIVLDQLDTLGLAVWYCDDGYYDPENRTAELHTEGFSIDENKFIKDWFKQRWALDAYFKKDPSNKRVLIRFSVASTDQFLNLIRNQVFEMPKSMRYKLGHIWQGNIDRLYEAKSKKDLRMKKYRERNEIKERDKIKNLEYYYKNREKILNYKKEYNQSPKFKAYLREYVKRLEVKERLKKYTREYRKKPLIKKRYLEYQREYRRRPEIIEKIKEYNKKARDKKKQGDKN